MTDDLVARLRKVGQDYDFHGNALVYEAADEIERLRAALREKDSIAYIIDSHGMTHQCFTIVYSAALAGEVSDDVAT